MRRLGFDERAVLTLYKRFFNEEYPSAIEDNTDAHVQAQKMCFLLSLAGVSVGGYGYTWDNYGPCSEGLQSQLRALDQNAEIVKAFYTDNSNEASLFSDDDIPGSLFTNAQKNQIDSTVRRLNIRAHTKNMRDWSEMLGSLAFLTKYVSSVVEYKTVLADLVLRKPHLADSVYAEPAWAALGDAGLI